MNDQRDAQQASAAGLGHVDFRLLGPLEAHVEGEPVALGAPKQRALLAHLLLRANEAVPVERLVDSLWPDEPPATARHAIHVYVSGLRRALGRASRIEAHAKAYVLRAGRDEVDLGRFRALVAEARDALAGDDPSAAAERLNDALRLWRERALADLGGEPGVRELVLELEEERVAAIELRILSKLQAGESGELVAELEQLVGEHPARDQLHADLMLALYRAGRHAEALDAYRRAQEALLNELGLEPSTQLAELEAAIRREDPVLTLESPELRARRHLPAQPNQFIGRERELDEVLELISARELRLVTLTGTGGIGKTRLALAAAERLAASFEDGAWFVDLSALADPVLVQPAVAQALGAAESPGRSADAVLEAHLADKELLLVVDNFEQVGAAAPSLSRLLRSAPRLTILVTSRSPLRLPEETEYGVPPLRVPDPTGDLSALGESEAVRLLTTRARAVARRFELTESNAGELAEICVALDGLPLAIELAGARLKDFTSSELRQRLERSLDLLVGGPVDVPRRQQTIRATIEWSHGLLGADEQQLFGRLAVFRGGWTAEAAGDVCGATGGSSSSLRDNGLIHSDEGRFAMLVPVREFALERLSATDTQTVARSHAEYFTRLAESADARARAHGRDPGILDDVGREYENFRAALSWAQDNGEALLVARLAAGLGQYWHSRGPYAEGRQWLEAALDNDLDDAGVVARAAFSLGMVCMQDGDYGQAKTAHSRALPLFRSMGDREMEARCLGNLGQAAVYLGDLARGREFLTESRELALGLESTLMVSRIDNALGVVELMEGRLGEAERWFEESLLACESIHEREGVGIALSNLGLIALQADRLEDAASRYREGLRLANELQHSHQMATCTQGLAAVAARRGSLGRAGHLLGVADVILEDSGAELPPVLSNLQDETRAAVRAGLGEEAAAEAFAAGRSQHRSDALAYAWNDG